LEPERLVHHQAPQELAVKDLAQHSRLMGHQPLVVVVEEISQNQIHREAQAVQAVVAVEPARRQQRQPVVQVLLDKATPEEQTQV
jgi:hypothetical protein